MQDESRQENSETDNISEPSHKAVNHFADAAKQVLSVFDWLNKNLSSNGNVFKIEDARGATAEISLGIPVGGTGEVTVVIGQSRKSYPAKAVREGESFLRGSKVRIADVAVSTMFVEAI